MTRSDKWKKRPAVVKYHNFKDQCRLYNVEVPVAGASITFNIAMPKSWSKAKKAKMVGQPHQQTPDLSNLLKRLRMQLSRMILVYGTIHFCRSDGAIRATSK